MRKSIVSKKELPGARDLSNKLFTRSPYSCHPEMRGNMGGVMYGQFIAHDYGMRQMYQTSTTYHTVLKRINNNCYI